MSRSTAAARVDVIHEVPARHVSKPPAAATPGPRPSAQSGYLFHPITDFILAGGGSVLVLAPVFWLIGDRASAHPTAVAINATLLLVLNYPHFAHSYQLLYDGIGKRIKGPDTTQKVRLKYIWAGFVAPLLIAGFLVTAYLSGNVRMLGYVAHAYFFSVGWHYVKQGYGVITVLSAVRRIYYSNLEKKLLLLNGYTVWIYSWMAFNDALRQDTLFGVKYFLLDIPQIAVTIGWWAVMLTTIALAAALAHRVFVRRQPVSWNGIVGYVSSLYLWVIAVFTDPIFTLFVPAFHSLQYLLFVWRYQINKAASEAPTSAADSSTSAATQDVKGRVARFVMVGMVLGFLGFVGVPMALQLTLAPDATLWGPTVFTFIFAAGINLHHYFIDNVIWRRDNEDVRRFLFAPR
jgi:hypothetical protein